MFNSKRESPILYSGLSLNHMHGYGWLFGYMYDARILYSYSLDVDTNFQAMFAVQILGLSLPPEGSGHNTDTHSSSELLWPDKGYISAQRILFRRDVKILCVAPSRIREYVNQDSEWVRTRVKTSWVSSLICLKRWTQHRRHLNFCHISMWWEFVRLIAFYIRFPEHNKDY